MGIILFPGAGWKCDKVIVKEGDAPDSKMFYFPCDKWFDTSAEDKEIVRELLPGEPPKDSRKYPLIHGYWQYMYLEQQYCRN